MKKLSIALVLVIVFSACSQNSPSHYFKNGNAQYQLKNYEGAIEQLNRAIELKENYKEAYYFRALCFVKMDDLNNALQDFNKAIELDTAYKEAYFSRAYYVKDQMGDYGGSIKDYNNYIYLNIDGSNAYALNNRGFAKYKQNDKDGALADIQNSLELDPKNAYAYKNLALIYISMDSLRPACENLQLALDHGYAREYDDEVNKLIETYCQN